jgi:hypothetical protein
MGDFSKLLFLQRLSEFAGWKENGPQACMLREVVDGLLEAFLLSLHAPDLDADSSPSCTEFKSKNINFFKRFEN